MRPTQYSTATLIDLFHRHTVASLSEVMAALGTRARRTAFRKLKELPYRTSYSHRGGYYTLEELIDFDPGLWSFRAVRFSAAGTLLATTAELVSDAPAGQFSEELDNLLHVGTQDALRKLVQQRKLTRQKVAGQFLYCAADRTRKAQQLSARRARLAAPGLVGPVPDADLRTNCAPLSCCSPACSTNASAGCTPALSPSSAVGAATPVSPGYSASTPVP